jgi:hypothetical protein
MEKPSLTALARQQFTLAPNVSSGPHSQTEYRGHGHPLHHKRESCEVGLGAWAASSDQTGAPLNEKEAPT